MKTKNRGFDWPTIIAGAALGAMYGLAQYYAFQHRDQVVQSTGERSANHPQPTPLR